jgi:3D (Asp-Asp-Asp) domain-containing protein
MLWRLPFRPLIVLALSLVVSVFFSSCGTMTTTTRALPPYEAPVAKTDYQTVRTTAYTHTEADHRAYTNHNALGGELHAAGPPIRRAERTSLTLALEEQNDYRRASHPGGSQPFSMNDEPAPRASRSVRAQPVTVKTARGRRVVVAKAKPPRIGSAAADWSRWPAGTTFRLISTGQLYRVDDYGWALTGRNTIDLYMATSSEMNRWGAREEPIQILQWGDAEQSLRLLQPHEEHKHIKRMVLELQGRENEAAELR